MFPQTRTAELSTYNDLESPAAEVDVLVDTFDLCVPRAMLIQMATALDNLAHTTKPQAIRKLVTHALEYWIQLADGLSESGHPLADTFNITLAFLLAANEGRELAPDHYVPLDYRTDITVPTPAGINVVIYPLGYPITTPYHEGHITLQPVLPTPLQFPNPRALTTDKIDTGNLRALSPTEPLIGYQGDYPLVDASIIHSYCGLLTNLSLDHRLTVTAVRNTLDTNALPLYQLPTVSWGLASACISQQR